MSLKTAQVTTDKDADVKYKRPAHTIYVVFSEAIYLQRKLSPQLCNSFKCPPLRGSLSRRKCFKLYFLYFKIQIKVVNALLLLQLRMKKVSGAAALDESSLFCRFLGSFHSIGNSIPRPSSSRNFSLSTLGVPEFSGIVPSRGFIVKSEMLFLGGNLVLNNKPN